MSEDQAYKDGDIVWVKLGNNWWPGEVIDVHRHPDGVVNNIKRKLYCIVKFFNENAYEYVSNVKQIYPFQCTKKEEFLKKGLSLHKSGNKFMEKFPEDVEVAERLTRPKAPSLYINDRPDSIVKAILGQPVVLTDADECYGSLEYREKRRSCESITKIINLTPNKSSVATSPSAPSPIRIENIETASSSNTAKNNAINISISSRTSSGDSCDRNISSSNKNTNANNYQCNLCGFTSIRQNVMIFHRKTHSNRNGQSSMPPNAVNATPKRNATTDSHTTISNTKVLQTIAKATPSMPSLLPTTTTPIVTTLNKSAINVPRKSLENTNNSKKKTSIFTATDSSDGAANISPVIVASEMQSRRSMRHMKTPIVTATEATASAINQNIANGSTESIDLPETKPIKKIPKKRDFINLHLQEEYEIPPVAQEVQISAAISPTTTISETTTPTVPKGNAEEIRNMLLADWSDEDETTDHLDRSENITIVSQNSETALNNTETDALPSSAPFTSTPSNADTKPLNAGRIRNIPKKDRRDVILQDFSGELSLIEPENESTTQALVVHLDSSSSSAIEVIEEQQPAIITINDEEEIVKETTTTATTEKTSKSGQENKGELPPSARNSEDVAPNDKPSTVASILSCFDFQDDEEDDDMETPAVVTTSIAHFKKKYLSSEKSQNNLGSDDVVVIAAKEKQQEEMAKKDRELAAEIESLLEQTQPSAADLLTSTHSFEESISVKDLPIKERGKRIFKSRNRSRIEAKSSTESLTNSLSTDDSFTKDVSTNDTSNKLMQGNQMENQLQIVNEMSQSKPIDNAKMAQEHNATMSKETSIKCDDGKKSSETISNDSHSEQKEQLEALEKATSREENAIIDLMVVEEVQSNKKAEDQLLLQTLSVSDVSSENKCIEITSTLDPSLKLESEKHEIETIAEQINSNEQLEEALPQFTDAEADEMFNSENGKTKPAMQPSANEDTIVITENLTLENVDERQYQSSAELENVCKEEDILEKTSETTELSFKLGYEENDQAVSERNAIIDEKVVQNVEDCFKVINEECDVIDKTNTVTDDEKDIVVGGNNAITDNKSGQANKDITDEALSQASETDKKSHKKSSPSHNIDTEPITVDDFVNNRRISTSPIDENSSMGASDTGAEFGSPASMLSEERLPIFPFNRNETPQHEIDPTPNESMVEIIDELNNEMENVRADDQMIIMQNDKDLTAETKENTTSTECCMDGKNLESDESASMTDKISIQAEQGQTVNKSLTHSTDKTGRRRKHHLRSKSRQNELLKQSVENIQKSKNKDLLENVHTENDVKAVETEEVSNVTADCTDGDSKEYDKINVTADCTDGNSKESDNTSSTINKPETTISTETEIAEKCLDVEKSPEDNTSIKDIPTVATTEVPVETANNQHKEDIEFSNDEVVDAALTENVHAEESTVPAQKATILEDVTKTCNDACLSTEKEMEIIETTSISNENVKNNDNCSQKSVETHTDQNVEENRGDFIDSQKKRSGETIPIKQPKLRKEEKKCEHEQKLVSTDLQTNFETAEEKNQVNLEDPTCDFDKLTSMDESTGETKDESTNKIDFDEMSNEVPLQTATAEKSESQITPIMENISDKDDDGNDETPSSSSEPPSKQAKNVITDLTKHDIVLDKTEIPLISTETNVAEETCDDVSNVEEFDMKLKDDLTISSPPEKHTLLHDDNIEAAEKCPTTQQEVLANETETEADKATDDFLKEFDNIVNKGVSNKAEDSNVEDKIHNEAKNTQDNDSKKTDVCGNITKCIVSEEAISVVSSSKPQYKQSTPCKRRKTICFDVSEKSLGRQVFDFEDEMPTSTTTNKTRKRTAERKMTMPDIDRPARTASPFDLDKQFKSFKPCRRSSIEESITSFLIQRPNAAQDEDSLPDSDDKQSVSKELGTDSKGNKYVIVKNPPTQSTTKPTSVTKTAANGRNMKRKASQTKTMGRRLSVQSENPPQSKIARDSSGCVVIQPKLPKTDVIVTSLNDNQISTAQQQLIQLQQQYPQSQSPSSIILNTASNRTRKTHKVPNQQQQPPQQIQQMQQQQNTLPQQSLITQIASPPNILQIVTQPIAPQPHMQSVQPVVPQHTNEGFIISTTNPGEDDNVIDSNTQLIALPTQPYPGYTETFLLCKVKGNTCKPVDNIPLYLNHQLNELVPIPADVLEAGPKLSTNGKYEISESNTQDGEQQHVVMEQDKSDMEQHIDTERDTLDSEEISSVIDTENILHQEFLEDNMGSGEEEAMTDMSANNGILINIEGQQVLLDAATFEHLLANPDANTQLISDDGTEYVLTHEVLQDLYMQQQQQQAQQQQEQHDIIAVAMAGSDLYGNEVLTIDTSQALQLLEGNGGLVFQQPPTTSLVQQHLTPPAVVTNAVLDQSPIMSTLEVPSIPHCITVPSLPLVSSSSIILGGSSRTNLDDSLAAIGVTAQTSAISSSLGLPITITDPNIASKVNSAGPLNEILQFVPHRSATVQTTAAAVAAAALAGESRIFND